MPKDDYDGKTPNDYFNDLDKDRPKPFHEKVLGVEIPEDIMYDVDSEE